MSENQPALALLKPGPHSKAARIPHKEMNWQTRASAWNLRGCHEDFERKWGLGRPETGSAFHH
jgi:hypothetical protein